MLSPEYGLPMRPRKFVFNLNYHGPHSRVLFCQFFHFPVCIKHS